MNDIWQWLGDLLGPLREEVTGGVGGVAGLLFVLYLLYTLANGKGSTKKPKKGPKKR